MLKPVLIGTKMGEKRWTGRAARVQAVASTAAAGVRSAAKRRIALTAAQVRSLGGIIGEMAATIPELIAGIEGPTIPLQEPWSIGLGQVLSRHPKLSGKLSGAVLNLDRLGHLQISPDAISFDGEAVPWDEITEIKFGPVVDLVTSYALQNEIGRLTARLPQLPGRDLLVRQAVDALVAVCLASAGATADQESAARQVDEAGGSVVTGVPVMVVYGGPARRRGLTPGVFVAVIAASIPSVSQAIAQFARERGIKISVAPPSRSRRQAIVMRNVADSLSARLKRGREARAIESGSDPELMALDSAAAGEPDFAGTAAGQSDADGHLRTPGDWDADDFDFGPDPATDGPTTVTRPPAPRLTRPITRSSGPPEFIVGESPDGVVSELQMTANNVCEAVQRNEPSASGVLVSHLLPRALDEIVAELQRRRVITGEPVIVKRNGGLLRMRTGEGLKVQLWLYPVDYYPDTAVLVRHDNDHRIGPDDSEDLWPAVLLAVLKTKAANLSAFDVTGKGDLEPSGALLEMLRESYLAKAKLTDPSDKRDFLPSLPPAVSSPRFLHHFV